VIRGMEHLSYEDKGLLILEKALWTPYSSPPVPEGGVQRPGEGLFTRARSDRTRGDGFKLKESRFNFNIRKKNFYPEGAEALEQIAQRNCGCPLPGSVQGQVGWGFEEPGCLDGVPAHGRTFGTRRSLRSLL